MVNRSVRLNLILSVCLVTFLFDSHSQVAAEPLLEEIVVTARKRPETLMDSPVAVSAVTGESMDAKGQTTLEQIAAGVPGLTLGRAPQNTNVAIRGIGSGFNKGFEQSVGMYVDGVYMPRSRQYSQALLDVQQVEILRGPQGMLFGKNTVAGAVKVTTSSARPGDTQTGFVNVDYEPDQSTSRLTGGFTVPLSDAWALRVAARYESSDGYVENLVDDEDQQQKENFVGRVSLAGDLSERLSLVAKLSYTDMEAEGVESSVHRFEPALGAGLGTFDTIGALMIPLAAPTFGPADGKTYDEYTSFTSNQAVLADGQAFGGKDKETTRGTLGSLTLEYAVDNYTFTSVTGLSDFRFAIDPHDVDYSPLNFINLDEYEDLRQYSQEFRIASDFDGAFNFVAGLYIEDQDLDLFQATGLDGTFGGLAGDALGLTPLGLGNVWQAAVLDNLGALAPVLSANFGCNVADLLPPASAGCGAVFSALQDTPNVIGWAFSIQQESRTYALFTEATFELTDTFRVDLGGRWSRDKKSVEHQLNNTIGMYTEIVDVNGNSTGAIANPITEFFTTGVVIQGAFASYPHDISDERTETHFDPSVRFSWDFSDNSMVYLTYNRGYKSGGFEASGRSGVSPLGTKTDGFEFEDEGVESFELGLRSTLLDGNMRLGITAFHSEFEDLQVSTFRGISFVVGNAAKAVSKGVELDVQVAINEYFEVGLVGSYLDNEYDSFPGAACAIFQSAAVARIQAGSTEPLPANVSVSNTGQCLQDLTGETTPFAPTWSAHLYGELFIPVTDHFDLSARLDLNYKDEQNIDLALEPTALIDSYTKVDARIALVQKDGQGFEMAIFGRNLTDEATHSFQVNVPLSAGAFARWIEEPRAYGLQLSYRY